MASRSAQSRPYVWISAMWSISQGSNKLAFCFRFLWASEHLILAKQGIGVERGPPTDWVQTRWVKSREGGEGRLGFECHVRTLCRLFTLGLCPPTILEDFPHQRIIAFFRKLRLHGIGFLRQSHIPTCTICHRSNSSNHFQLHSPHFLHLAGLGLHQPIGC